MKIRIMRMGQVTKELELADGLTIEDAAKQAEFPTSGFSVALNGVGASLETGLSDGDIISLVPKVSQG